MTKKRRRGPCIIPLLSADRSQEAGSGRGLACSHHRSQTVGYYRTGAQLHSLGL